MELIYVRVIYAAYLTFCLIGQMKEETRQSGIFMVFIPYACHMQYFGSPILNDIFVLIYLDIY